MSEGRTSSLALLRLLQAADSSFPVGGFAYSHGLEWLAHEGVMRAEAALDGFFATFVEQSIGGQLLPAALRVCRAGTVAAVLKADDELDASFGSAVERMAGRVMGERLLLAAAGAFPGERVVALAAAVGDGTTPGQYATAFAAVAMDQGVEERETLLALSSTLLISAAQAAIRLGLVGQEGATRLVARASVRAADTVDGLVGRRRIPRPGAFAPGIDLAGTLHPTLPFRMFAS